MVRLGTTSGTLHSSRGGAARWCLFALLLLHLTLTLTLTLTLSLTLTRLVSVKSLLQMELLVGGGVYALDLAHWWGARP